MQRLSAKVHPALADDVVEALHSKQLFTVLDFVNADTDKIVKITRLSFREILALKNVFLKNFSAAPVNGFDCYKTTLSNAAIIPTGIESIDQLLNGGLFTGNIYEICGLPASGKTHFALNLAKNVVLNMKQRVYFFDTKNDFCARKLKNMLSGCNQEQLMESLDKIVVKRTYTKWDLINGLYELKNSLKSDVKLRLIIIDSLPAVLFNSTDHVKNNAYLSHLVNVLRYITVEHHVALLITNLMITWNKGDFKNQQNTMESVACGKFWSNVPNTRLKIKKTENQNNECTVTILKTDSYTNKEKNVNILLTSRGIS